MSQNRKRRPGSNEIKKQKKVIRCTALNRPVFEHEVCAQFRIKISSNNKKSCENCKYSF